MTPGWRGVAPHPLELLPFGEESYRVCLRHDLAWPDPVGVGSGWNVILDQSLTGVTKDHNSMDYKTHMKHSLDHQYPTYRNHRSSRDGIPDFLGDICNRDMFLRSKT